MDDYSPFVPNVHFEKIPIKNLVSNQDYQRNLSQARIEKTAENFDLFQINPVKVSRRDGINYVFNGQHTIEIVALASGSRETPVWCMIYDDLCYEHEADIFANQMKFAKNLAPFEIFVANLEAKNQEQLILCGYREHGFIRLFYTATLLTDSFSVGCQYCSRCVFDKNRRVFTSVIAYSGILSCGYASGNIGNDRIGVHIDKIQSGFTAPTA